MNSPEKEYVPLVFILLMNSVLGRDVIFYSRNLFGALSPGMLSLSLPAYADALKFPHHSTNVDLTGTWNSFCRCSRHLLWLWSVAETSVKEALSPRQLQFTSHN